MAKKKTRKKSETVSPTIATAFMIGLLVVLTVFVFSIRGPSAIDIGLNAELTGNLAPVGLSSKRGAEMAIKEINYKGGIEVNGKKHHIDLILQDNGSEVETSKLATQKLLDAGVSAMIGPNASKFAMAAATVAEDAKMIMISPWSTDPQTTLNADGTHREYVYRAAFTDPFQGKALAHFAHRTLGLTKAAVLYDVSTPVLQGQAETFRQQFIDDGGDVVTVQTFKAGDQNVDDQLNQILNSHAELIFLPAYTIDATTVIKRAKELDISVPFLGSDAWGNQEILATCGSLCNGYYVSAHFSADSQNPATQEFVKDYQAAYGIVPDDVAALTFDSVQLLVRAIQNARSFDRTAVKNGMSNLGLYDGATGEMTFDSVSGDPVKSVFILQVAQNRFNYVTTINPE